MADASLASIEPRANEPWIPRRRACLCQRADETVFSPLERATVNFAIATVATASARFRLAFTGERFGLAIGINVSMCSWVRKEKHVCVWAVECGHPQPGFTAKMRLPTAGTAVEISLAALSYHSQIRAKRKPSQRKDGLGPSKPTNNLLGRFKPIYGWLRSSRQLCEKAYTFSSFGTCRSNGPYLHPKYY